MHRVQGGTDPVRPSYIRIVGEALSLRERLAVSVNELDSLRLQRRFQGVPVSSIRDVVERRPARFGGEVRSQQHSSPESRPMLRVTVSDGTGTAVAVFTGRRRIRGLDAGGGVLLEGVARREGDRVIVLNPAYTLLP